MPLNVCSADPSLFLESAGKTLSPDLMNIVTHKYIILSTGLTSIFCNVSSSQHTIGHLLAGNITLNSFKFC